LEYRQTLMIGYWKHAEKSIIKAKKIADCRGQSLLIYFATDDAQNLRPIVTEKYSKYGRVIFGLDENEVGHMSPQWTATDEKVLERIKKTGMYTSLHFTVSQR